MVAWFIVAILTVGLFAFISLSGVSLVSNSQSASSKTETVRRLNAVVQSLQSQAAAPNADGILYMPAGSMDTTSGYYGLPTSLRSIGNTTFGSHFLYCPMGLTLDTANDTVTSNGGSYNIRTATLNSKTYVVTGRLATSVASDPNIMGFVVAQTSPDVAMPGCGDITASGDGYAAPNGLVRAVKRISVASLDATRAYAGNIWYVTTSGTGTGQSMSSPTTLANALAAYQTSLGDTFTIIMGAGTYAVSGNPLDQTLTSILPKKNSSALILNAPSNATLQLGTSINVPGSLELKNVNVQGTTVYADSGHYTRASGSNLGPVIAAARSRFIFSGTNTVRAIAGGSPTIYQAAGSTLVSKDATVTLYYVNGIPALRMENGSSGVWSTTTLNVSPADSTASGTTQNALLTTDNGSQLIFKTSTVNFNGASNYGLFVTGRMTAYSSVFASNASTYVALQTYAGGTMDLPSVTIAGSTLPSYDISSVQSPAITGSGNLYASNRCWYRGGGTLFRYSQIGVSGQNSLVGPDEVPPAMNANPTAAQVQAYQAAVARNAERLGIRGAMNAAAGSFTCAQSAPPVWTNCAGENGYCTVPNYTMVRYGASGSYYYQNATGGISCSNGTFGDPIVGTVKTCDYAQ